MAKERKKLGRGEVVEVDARKVGTGAQAWEALRLYTHRFEEVNNCPCERRGMCEKSVRFLIIVPIRNSFESPS